MTDKPDFNSYTYNYRKERFREMGYPFDTEMGSRWLGWAMKPGIVPETNEQVYLDKDNNKLTVNLFHKDNDCGFHVDSFGMLYGRWLKSLRQDQYRKDAWICNYVGLVIQDQRARETTNNFSDSPKEQATPPDLSKLPSEQEWLDILHRAQGEK